MISKLLIPIFIISIIFISGCTSTTDVSSIAKSLPEVQSFLDEHPNADITVVLWNSEYIQTHSEEIPEKCLPAIDMNTSYYKVDISEEGDTIITFLNSDTREVVCIVRSGLGEEESTNKSENNTNNSEDNSSNEEDSEDKETNYFSCEDFTKTDSPELDAFVVSYCPYGLQMQRILVKVVEEAPSLEENINIKYMSAMHGNKESEENLRQLCIREEHSDKFWDYLSCFIKSGTYKSCLSSLDITNEVDECMYSEERGLKYMEEDIELQEEYSIKGSPSVVLNGDRAREFDFDGRTANSLKQVICCGFDNKPYVCYETLTQETAETGFSYNY